MAEQTLIPRGERSKPDELSGRVLRYIGRMVKGIETARKYRQELEGLGPEKGFERVFGIAPKGPVMVDYKDWAIGFLVGDEDFGDIGTLEGMTVTGEVEGMILENSPLYEDMEGRSVAAKTGEHQEERLGHERQHLRLFHLGRDYREAMRNAVEAGSVDMFVSAYKAKMVDELICSLAAGMPLDVTLDSLNTEFKRMQDALRGGIIPGEDFSRHVSAGPLEREDLRVENRAIVNLVGQTSVTLPTEYVVQLMLSTGYDNIQTELMRSEKAFR